MLPPLRRHLAASLASLALLVFPARGLLACEMGAAATVDTVHQHAAGAMAGHDHAAMSTDAGAPDDTGDGPDSGERQHPSCDHLVGCAPLALATTATISTRTTVTLVRPVPFVAGRVESPARSLEPPPPKG